MSENVDTKVVSLEFDNKQFEAGVKTSMDTLEKLKASLNFDKNADSLKSLQTTMDGFDTSNISDSIETVNAKWSAMQVIGTTALANITNSAVNLGKKILSGLTSSITQGGWNRALKIEQAKFQIEGLGHAWEEYADAIDYGVKDTAYGLDSAARAASMFLASGVTDANKMGGYLRAISGVAAMGGRDYDSVANIFAKIAGQGRVMGDELNQMAAMGINAAATMAEQFGITEAEVRDLVRKGKVSFTDFADAMDNAFGEHAKDANKTFTGALSNVKAALSRIGAKVATPLLKNLTDLFNWLRTAINQANKALDPFINGLNRVQDAITDSLGVFITGTSRDRSLSHFKDEMEATFGDDTQQVMKDFKASLRGIVGKDEFDWWVKKYGFEGALKNGVASADQISKAFEEVADSAKYSTDEMQEQREALRKMSIDATNVGTSINRWFSDMEKTDKYAAYDKLSKAYHDAGLEYWRDVRPALIEAGNRRGVDVAKIIDDYGSIREAVKYGAIDVEIFKDAFNDLAKDGSEEAKALAKEISNSNTELGKLIDRLGDRPSLTYIAEIFSNLVSLIGKPLSMIVSAFTEVFSGSIFSSLNEMLGWLADITGELQFSTEFLEGFKSLIKGILSIIKSAGGIVYRVLKIPMVIIKSLLSGLMAVFDAGSSLFGWFASGFGVVLQDISHWIDSLTIVETITNVIKDIFYKIGYAIGSVINTIRESETFQNVVTKIKDAIWTVYSVVKDIFRSIKLDGLLSVLLNIIGAIAELFDYLLNLPGVQKAIGYLATGLEKVAGFIANAADAIKRFFDSVSTKFDFISKFKEIGTNMWKGLIEGFNFSAVLSAIGGFFESLIQFVCDILGIHSPSTEFMYMGEMSAEGYGQGFIVEFFKNTFPNMFGALTAFFSRENLLKIKEVIVYWADQLIEVFAHVAQSLLDAIKKLDVGEAILGGGFILGARFLWKLPDVIREIVVPLHDFSSSLAKVGNAIATTVRKLGRVFDTLRDYIKSLKYGEYAELIKAFALLFAILAATLFMIYKMVQNDPDSLVKAGIIVGAMLLSLTIMFVALSKIGRGPSGVRDALITLGAVSGFLLVLSGVMLIYVRVLDKLRGFSILDIITAGILLGGLFAAIYVLLNNIWKRPLTKIESAVSLVLSVSALISAIGAFLIFAAIAFRLIGGMPFDSWVQGLVGVGLVIGGLVLLFFLLNKWNLTPAKEAEIVTKLGGIVTVVLALAATLAILAFIAHMDILSAVIGVGLMMGLVVVLYLFELLLIRFSDLAVGKRQAKKMANGLRQLILPIAILAVVVAMMALLARLGWDQALFGLVSVITFALILWGFSKILVKFDNSKLSGLRMLRVSKSLLIMAGTIGILAVVGILVSRVNFWEACKGALNLIPFVALVILMVWAMTGMAKKLEMNEPWMLRANYTLLYVVVAVGLLAGIALLISALDPQDFWKGIVIVGTMSVFMSILMFAFGQMARYFVYESNLGKAYAATFIATLFIAAWIGLLFLISKSGADGDVMVKAAEAVSLMGLTVVAILAVLMILGQKFMRLSGIDLKGVMALMEPLTALVGIMALLVLIAYMASYLPSGAAESILILSLALMALVPTALAISKMSSISGLNVANTFIMVGVLAALSVILALLVGVAALASLIPSSAVDTLERLASILLVMVVVAGVLTLLGFAAGAAVAGGLAFAAITIIITVVGLILGLFAELDAASGLITKGFDLLIMIAEKLGEAIGAFFYGMAAGMGNQDWSWLEKLQAALEPFMTFVSGFSAADVEGVQAMADVIEQISDIGYINSQTTKFGGTSGIDDFAESVPKLATALKSFNDNLGDGFDKALVSEAASSISALAESYVKISESTGSQDITKFTSNMPNLATALTGFADSVSDFKMTEGLQTSLDTLTNLSTTMPILTDIGNYKMNNFADSMTQLGTGLKNFSESISKIKEGAENSSAVKLAQTLVDLSQTLGGASGDDMGLGIMGGIVTSLFGGGDADLGKFGKQCEDLGAGLAAYAKAAGQIPDSFNENKGAVAVKLAQNLIELGKATGNANGLIMIPMLSTMMGNTDASDAVSRVKALGEVLVAFAGSLSEMPETLPSGLDKLVDVVKLMSMDWPEEIPNITPGESLSLKLFSSTLKTYAENLSGDALTILTDSGPALQSFAKGLGAISNVDSDKIANAINAVKAVNSKSVVESATNLVSSFGNAVSSASSGQSTGMAEAGTNMAKSMSDGFGKASSKYMKGAADNTATSAIGAFKSQLSKFTDAGTSAGQGFANGLRSTLPSTEAAASSLSSGAINKLKKLLDIKSPSRVLYGIGAYAGEGFVNGFASYKSAVILAAQNMGNSLIDNVNDTISSIGSDLSPVITPVMDLSDVSRGTSAIRSMLDGAMNNSALGNLGGITNAMTRNSSRASNDDVVAAVDALRGDISALATNTTTIGDITLDGSGEVMAAVETLARYATLERRS